MGKNSASKGYNGGSIMPGGHMSVYTSQDDFVDHYVATITRNFPKVLNTGADVKSFVDGLKNGRYGTYFDGTEEAYYDELYAIYRGLSKSVK